MLNSKRKIIAMVRAYKLTNETKQKFFYQAFMANKYFLKVARTTQAGFIGF